MTPDQPRDEHGDFVCSTDPCPHGHPWPESFKMRGRHGGRQRSRYCIICNNDRSVDKRSSERAALVQQTRAEIEQYRAWGYPMDRIRNMVSVRSRTWAEAMDLDWNPT